MATSNFHPFALPVAAPVGAPAVLLEPPPHREIRFRFTGDAKEYFRIWIVNVALTILSVGVYSAWAKVRTKQYFYRNTWIEDASFEYLADPVSILKGRIVIALALGLLFGAQYYSLALYIALVVVMLLLTPFFLVKSLAFNARNSAYRNVRFTFLGNTGEAFGIYLQVVLMYLVTCGLAYPYAQWRMTHFVVQRHLFGDERFQWSTKPGEYFRVFLVGLLLVLPVYALLIAFVVASVAGRGGGAAEPVLLGAAEPVLLGATVVFYAALLIPAAYVRAKIANVLYNGISVGPHRLASNQRPLDLLKLYVTNALGVVLSLGLLFPWAKIRLARYRAAHLALIASGPLHAGNFDLARAPGALGDAAVDLGDYDFDLGA
jgi:uncharacterized membrane protein YjgN (DUF898 family)